MHMISGLRKSAVALAAGAGLFLAASQAQAVIVWSGVVNLAIPSTTNGLYLNVLTGANNLPGSTNGATVPRWDINPYGSGSLLFYPTQPPAPANTSGYTNQLSFGTPIGASFIAGIVTPPVAAWNLNSTNNFVGFRFLNEGADLASPADDTVHYGWMQLGMGASVNSRTLVSYAFESTPLTSIPAGVIPEPSTYAVMGLGLAGLMVAARRRKQA